MFKIKDNEEYKEATLQELEELRIKTNKNTSNNSWGYELMAIDNNNTMYLQLKEF